MPSRQLYTSPPSSVIFDQNPPAPSPNQPFHHHNQYQRHHLLRPLLASTASACSFFLLILLCFRKVTRKRTTPSSDSESKPPYRFSYTLLRRATNSFSTRLGHGGFGPVFSGTLPSTQQPIAVKLMDSASLQGEREFHNELFFASRLCSQHVVSAIGFCSDSKHRRFLLVYELMHNGNLQDALLHKKCPELLDWKRRFAIIIDIAKAIQYLHSCDPPVIHGDIKPSNMLLDRYFSAKIGDFGLARLKSESQLEIDILGVDDAMRKMNNDLELEQKERKEELESTNGVETNDCGSVVEETESVNTGFEERGVGVDRSPDGFIKIPILETSPETIEESTVSPETALAAAESPSAANFDKASTQSEKVVGTVVEKNGKELRSSSVKDLWLKQDNEETATPVAGNKKVKDYVMEWIGKEVNQEPPKTEFFEATSSKGTKTGKIEKKKSRKKLEWWALMEEDGKGRNLKKEKRRPAREWWKEEYCEELSKKKKKKKKQQQKKGVNSDHDWWVGEDDLHGDRKKAKSRSSSIDWWLNGLSGDLMKARKNSYDCVSASGEIPKSGNVSSTPSMRGTVCYVAPEYGYGGDVSEKCDVYSFGVLLLVIISGRRPLQVTNSPLSEFQRANLLSWARHCARSGKLLDLVDQSVESLDKEQAVLCITVALHCLLKSADRRPSMKEVLGMLSGELEPPELPVEYSPSPQSRFSFKSRKKCR